MNSPQVQVEVNSGWDLIGDLHGHHEALCQLLTQLGYQRQQGTYTHPEQRRLIFLGDLVDRGPAVRETVRLVRDLVESGLALCIMANHEYNMICYHSWVGGDFLRPHNARHDKQVAVSLAAFDQYPAEWLSHLEWFKTLPLLLELPGLRVIHACWDQTKVERLKERLPNLRLTPEFLYESAQAGSEAHSLIEALLKGWEGILPAGQSYRDAEGLIRTETRLRWWPKALHHSNSPDSQGSWQDWLVTDAGATGIENLPFEHSLPGPLYAADAPPVFFGHYWLRGTPQLQTDNVCCLDYSIAKGGSLVAYRWSGEARLDAKNFVVAGL